ncbi:MAG: cytochrome b/b6 domain-containing protein [Pseudomonadota bacterium]
MAVTRYKVWDRTTRWFHWINVVCVTALGTIGLILLNEKLLGVPSGGKITLKTVHVAFGYVFCLNLLWRFVWAFISNNRFARWQAILPFRRGYARDLGRFLTGLRRGDISPYLGRNPLTRPMITLLLLLMTLQAGTGLLLAGTDLYQPPFGGMIAAWVAKPGKAAEVAPGSKENIDARKYAEMRKFRAPSVTVHIWTFYTLALLIFLHVAAAVISDILEKNGLISSMFSGEKIFSDKPVDFE